MSATPYPTAPNWPAAADREHYRAEARRSCPAAADDQIEQLARTMASQDAAMPLSRFNKGLVRAAPPLEQAEAQELAFTRAVPHSPYGFAIVDRAA